MSYVAGADFGTLSVRVTLMDVDSGATIASTAEGYPLRRDPTDPLIARQSHADHMAALTRAMQRAITSAGISGYDIAAFAADTTGSSVIIVDDQLNPLSDYYLWADHSAYKEADEITKIARKEGLEALDWCGGTYSHEWGYAKLLHFLRNNPQKRHRVGTALEHCDMLTATLSGVRDPGKVRRSVCAMGHKWMWNPNWGGYPPQSFLSRVDPLLDGINAKLDSPVGKAPEVAGHLCTEWAEKLGLKPGIPIPYGAFDAHWDALGCGGRPGDVVNVVGTSTCFIAIASNNITPVPGICGAVPGSVTPHTTGIEAGQSATGDLFEAIARRANSDVASLMKGLDTYLPGQTGLMRMTWDNGDRTVLVRPDLGGVTLGWDLGHSAADELHAAIEGMAMHTRIIHERISQTGMRINHVINGGGIPQKNNTLNQIYADVLGYPILVPETSPTGIGSCIMAAVAGGFFDDIANAQDALAPPSKVFSPDASRHAIYEELFALFHDLYMGFGEGASIDLGNVLPRLRSFRLDQA